MVSIKGFFGEAVKNAVTYHPGFTEAIRRTIVAAATNNGATIYDPTTAPERLADYQITTDGITDVDVRATAGTVYMDRPIRTIRIQLVEVEL